MEAGYLLRAALWYASHGIPVFPLKPGGKEPLTQHGFHDASAAEAVIRAWWRAHPDANIGVPTGAASGRVALDVDPRNHGDDSLAEIVYRHGPLPNTMQAITGGGGRHYIFQDPGEICRTKVLADGLDFKGAGGYIAVAPSIHPSGVAYAWDDPDTQEDFWADPHSLPQLLEPATMPVWLLERTSQQPREHKPTASDAQGDIPEGGRNTFLTSWAGYLRRKGATAAMLYAALNELNQERCKPPLHDVEVRRITQSVGRYQPELTEPDWLQSPVGEPLRAEAAIVGAQLAEPSAAATEPVAAPQAQAPPEAQANPQAAAPAAQAPPEAQAPPPSRVNGLPHGPNREQVLDWVTRQVGFPVLDIAKYEGDEPSYMVAVAGGAEIEFADTAALFNQAGFRYAVAAKTNLVMRRFNPANWEKILSHMIPLATVVPPNPEELLAGQLALAIDDYLASTAFVMVLEEQSLFEQNGPTFWHGRIALTTMGLMPWLRQRAPHLMVTNKALCRGLIALGAERERTCGWYLRKWRWLLPVERFSPERYADDRKNKETVQ